MGDARDHQSHRDTERRSYERLREAGVLPGPAAKEARDAADQTHRQIDRLNSDKTPRRP